MATDLPGLNMVLANLKNVGAKMTKAITKAVEVTATKVANDAKMNHYGSGRKARVNKQGKVFEAVGAAHAMGRYADDTHHLTQSIVPEDHARITFSGIECDVKAGHKGELDYAAAVEFGTPRSRPYPYLQPAILGQTEQFRTRMTEALKGATK
jgi:hypothetical protein